MAQFTLPFPKIQDPGYGTVSDLCAYLGYPTTLDHGRKGSKLANAVLKYRKRKADDPNVAQCPLDCDTPEAEIYAKSFIEENGEEFFQPSAEADERGWPSLPQHVQKITEGLKKLICLQEYFWRRNQNYFQKRDWDIEHNIGNHDQVNGDQDTPVTKSKGIKKEKHEQAPEIEQHILENIAVHLEFAYPLEGYPNQNTSWLFEPLKFNYGKINPKIVDPFVIRYLHEHSLYNTTSPADVAAVDQFAKDAKKNYRHLEYKNEWHDLIRDRCELIVQKFADAWKEWEKEGYGFLEEVDGVFRKSPQFEKAWALRRVDWLQKVHGGSTATLIEWLDVGLSQDSPPKTERDGPTPQGSKRGFTAVNHSATSKKNPSAKKRPRVDIRNPSAQNTPNSAPRFQVPEELVEESPSTIVVRHSATPLAQDPQAPTILESSASIKKSPSAADATESLVNIAKSSYQEEHEASHTSQIPPPVSSSRASVGGGFTPVNKAFTPVNVIPASANSSGSFVSVNGTNSPLQHQTPIHRQSSHQHQIPHQHQLVPGDLVLKSSNLRRQEPQPPTMGNPFGAGTPYEPQPTHSHPSHNQATAYVTPYGPHPYGPHPGYIPPVVFPSVETFRPALSSPTPPTIPSVSSAIPRDIVSPTPEPENQYPHQVEPPPRAKNYPLPVGAYEPRAVAQQHQQSPAIKTDQVAPSGFEARQTPQAPWPGANYVDRNPSTPGHRLSTSTDLRRESLGTPSDSKRHILQFAIQDDSGVPDDDPESLVAKKYIWDMDVATLFAMVSHKSGKPYDELEQLTFRCQWEPASVVVSKASGDDAWKRQKKKLNSLFMAAQSEFTDPEMSFEVWVLCGDRVSKKAKKPDVEDDMD